jgi:hypothetical protein
MKVPLIDAILGFVIAAACIGIPQLVRKRRQRPDDNDTEAYLEETGRSAGEIAQENAALRVRQQHDIASKHASGSGSRAHDDAAATAHDAS